MTSEMLQKVVFHLETYKTQMQGRVQLAQSSVLSDRIIELGIIIKDLRKELSNATNKNI